MNMSVNFVERPRATVQKNKGYWYAMFRVRDSKNGKLKQKAFSTHVKAGEGNEGKRKAEKAMNQIVDEYMQRNCMLFEDVLFSTYLDDYLKRKKMLVRETTYFNERNMYERHIKPYFLQRKITLSQLSAMDIERYILEKRQDTTLSVNTILKHYQFMRAALQDAVNKDILRKNPAKGVNTPKKEAYHADYYTENELKKTLAITKGTDIEVPIYLCIHFGLRRSEAMGLKWSAIDFEKKEFLVCNTVTRKECNDGKRKTMYVAKQITKTESSRRKIPLSDSDVAYLKSMKTKQEGCFRETEEYADYVCVNEVGNLINPEHIGKKFSKILKEHEMRHIRLHDLRHSAISLLIAKGVPASVVQAIAGHSSIKTTIDTYTHIGTEQKKEAIAEMSNALDV